MGSPTHSRRSPCLTLWSIWNWLAEQPNHGRFMNIAGDGRQRTVISGMSVSANSCVSPAGDRRLVRRAIRACRGGYATSSAVQVSSSQVTLLASVKIVGRSVACAERRPGRRRGDNTAGRRWAFRPGEGVGHPRALQHVVGAIWSGKLRRFRIVHPVSVNAKMPAS
jgi:hypothetical protein